MFSAKKNKTKNVEDWSGVSSYICSRNNKDDKLKIVETIVE